MAKGVAPTGPAGERLWVTAWQLRLPGTVPRAGRNAAQGERTPDTILVPMAGAGFVGLGAVRLPL